MRSLAAWCIRHRLIVVLAWVVMLIASFAMANGVGTSFKNNFDLPSTESTRAFNELKAAYPKVSGDVERIVFEVPAGHQVTDPATKAAVQSMLSQIATLKGVGTVQSPYDPTGVAQISSNGRASPMPRSPSTSLASISR